MVKWKDVISSDSFDQQIMEPGKTRAIAADYINYRLERNGYHWDNGRQSNVSPDPVETAMRNLGDEFEERFRDRFDGIIQQLNLTEENAHDTFHAIVAETFTDGVNWGRVVALFGFAGRFAVQCYQLNMSHMVDNVVDWVSIYVDTNLSTWMTSQNGWEGFLEFHAGGPESRRDDTWPSFRTICGYAAAGLGFLTLGAFLTQKS